MKTWQAGREKSLLDDIKGGTKTVEGRLYRDKFAEYKVGDQVSLRADTYDADGTLLKEEPNQALVEITKIERFATFADMLSQIGYQKVVPRAESVEQAIAEYAKYYSPMDEDKYGVVAVHVRMIS